MKQLVSLSVPAISQDFDILIPNDLEIIKVIPLLSEAVEVLSNHMYISSGEEILCSPEKNLVLIGSATLSGYGIQHGEKLVLL